MVYHKKLDGDFALCEASVRDCPREHFETLDEAYESLAREHKTMSSVSRTVEAIALGEVLDLELLNKMKRERYIYESVHPDDDSYALLCYTQRTQVTGKWNDATKMARGLIVQRSKDDYSDAVILERPWGKFFTLQQQESGWHFGDEDENSSAGEDSFASLDFNAPAAVYDKMDGSLGILYVAPDGKPAFATKGSFASEQALEYSARLRRDEASYEGAIALLRENLNTTALFELVGANNQIVLKYDRTEAVLLGGSRKRTGENVLPERLRGWGNRGLPVVERMEARTLTEALAIPPRENREGVVVSVGGENPMKIKIKQDDYIRMHRILASYSKKETRAVVREAASEMTFADLVSIAKSHEVREIPKIREILSVGEVSGNESAMHEAVQKKREDYFKKIIVPRAELIANHVQQIEALPQELFEGENPKKEFALRVREMEGDYTTLLSLFNARLQGRSLETIYAEKEMTKAIREAKKADEEEENDNS